MTRVRGPRIAAIAAALIGCLALARTAAADPPDRVGRVSQVIGPVSFRPATLDDWGDAVPNYPLTSGDNLWADRAARAELQLGGATARLGADTSFGVLNLDDRIAQFRLTQGSVALSVNDIADQLYEVDTPNGAVSLLQPGFYRIDVNDAGDSTFVTVRRGEADVTAGDGRPVTLHDNQSVSLIGLDDPRMDITGVRASDEWEDWCRRRDQDAYDAVTARYVSPYTVGYSDLDDYGTWRNVDRYGPIWMPRVHSGWAPYQEGRWVWVEPWGWTWVDDQPWGFAPSHYGRWVNLNGSWGWWPGARVNRAIYAPALVAFIGNTAGRALLSADTVAWFPLGPDEPYVPTYRVSPTYVRAINVADVRAADISVARVNYVNRVVPGAVTAVPRRTFVSATPVKAVARALPVDEIREAPIVGTAPSVAPAPSSVVVKVHDRVAVPQAPVMQRRVIAKTAPPPLPVPFAARESAMKEHPGRPVDPQTLGDLRTRTQPAAATPPVRVVTATAPAQGQRRQEPNPVTPAVGQEQPPRGNGRPRQNEAVPSSTERSARPPENTNAAPERQEESRTTAVPKRMTPPTPPEPPQPPQAMPRQNSDEGRLAAQQAAERARLEAQHAAEQERFEAQRAAEQKRAQDAQAQAQMKRQEEQQKRQMDDRQVREHQQLQQQQQAEKARQHQAPEAKPQQQQPPEAKAPRGQSGKGQQQKPSKEPQQKPPKPKGNDGASN